MDRSNIDKIAQTPEDRLLLAKLWDKLSAGIRKNIPANSTFLSPREQQLARYLFGNTEGIRYFGGYEDAERRMIVYLPDYLDANYLTEDDSPLVCLHADFYKGDSPTHRDFLGALTGIGIARDAIGDILVGSGCCDFFVTAQIVPWLLENFESAGRTALKLSILPLCEVTVPEQSFEEITDTVASLRLDNILSSAFRISRSLAYEYIKAGKVCIDSLVCEKPDRAVSEGSKLSVRGLGKALLYKIGSISKKGRIFLTIRRYQ